MPTYAYTHSPLHDIQLRLGSVDCILEQNYENIKGERSFRSSSPLASSYHVKVNDHYFIAKSLKNTLMLSKEVLALWHLRMLYKHVKDNVHYFIAKSLKNTLMLSKEVHSLFPKTF